jgi:hypothetical protein
MDLLIKNRTGEAVSLVWTSKPDSLTLDMDNKPISKRDIISLGPRRPDRDAVLFFGSGMWTDEFIENYVRERVQSIELIGETSSVFYSEPESIIKFLKAGKRSIPKNKIVIILR